jgi:hypothetical protein
MTAPGWQASPRWAAIKGNGCIEVEPDQQAKSGTGKAGMKVEACGGDKAKAPPQEKSVEIALPEAAEMAPQGEPVEIAAQDADPNMPAPE